MQKIIDGKAIAEKIDKKTARKIFNLNGPRPNLAIILIGNNPDSELYVSMKEKQAKRVGIDTHLYKCPDNIPETEIFSMIDHLNKDELIDAILVQLPLPKNYDTDRIILTIDPKKDVDRFHPDNLAALLKTCEHGEVMPPVYEAILAMLKEINFSLDSKKVCLVINSDIFGLGLKKVLECLGAQVDIVKANDKDIKNHTLAADLLISAIGKKHFIKKTMIKKDAVVIDIGITKEKAKVYGDVDFDNIKDKASFVSPVPGGVGPMTIAMLFKNTLALYFAKQKINK